MKGLIKYISVLFLISLVSACSDNNSPMRIPSDIYGVWSPDNETYFEYCEENIVHKLQIEFQDNESIGEWTKDVYYYEPGYNLVIYLAGENKADVYQIVEMTEQKMTWCWVDEVVAVNTESVGHIIGDIIKQAQEGYKLNPALYKTFVKIPQEKFFSILESLDIEYPWVF